MKKVDPIKTRTKVQEMQEYLDSEDGNPRDALLFQLGIVTMLRISDLLDLKYDDFFDKDGRFRDRWVAKENKTGRSKYGRLNQSTRDRLRGYCERFGMIPGDYLFFSMTNPKTNITRECAWQRLKPVAEKLNIKNFGTHSLRKTIPYQTWKETKNIRLCQKMLNHKSPATTLEYLGIEQEMTDDYVERIADRLF